jgi:uncharacterized protein (DUF433 family)
MALHIPMRRLTHPTVPAMLLTFDSFRITIEPTKRIGKPCIRGIPSLYSGLVSVCDLGLSMRDLDSPSQAI